MPLMALHAPTPLVTTSPEMPLSRAYPSAAYAAFSSLQLPTHMNSPPSSICRRNSRLKSPATPNRCEMPASRNRRRRKSPMVMVELAVVVITVPPVRNLWCRRLRGRGAVAVGEPLALRADDVLGVVRGDPAGADHRLALTGRAGEEQEAAGDRRRAAAPAEAQHRGARGGERLGQQGHAAGRLAPVRLRQLPEAVLHGAHGGQL